MPSPALFPREGLKFLRELALHNERDWFKPRQEEYERVVLEPLKASLLALSAAFEEAGVPLRADAKKSVFRVHRDVRFSADKRPYKSNASGILSPGADKSRQGIAYLHFEPGGCFVAVGFYQPEKDDLRKWRISFVERTREFQKVLQQLGKAGLELRQGDSLAKMPRDFTEYADSPLEACFRLKSFIVSRPLSDREATGPELVPTVLDFVQKARPLLEYGWLIADR